MITQREDYRTNQKGDSDVEMPGATEMVSERLIQIIWRQRWIVPLTTVVVLAAALFYLAKATPIYTSTSRIYVEQSGPKIIAEAEGVMTQSKNYLYTQAELLKSTPILTSALEKPGVKEMKIFRDVDNPVAFLKKKGLYVSVGKKDDIISVSSDSPAPAEAAQLVNAVVDSYITYQAARKRNTAAEVLKILQKEKAKCDAELAEKLKATMDFKKKNIALAFENGGSNIILDRLARLSEAMTQAQLHTIETKSAYEVTRSMVADSAKIKEFVEAERAKRVYVSASDERYRLETELNQLNLERAELARRVTVNHPSAKALKEKADQIKNQLDDIDGTFAMAQLAVAEQQYLAAKEKEEEVANYFEQQRQQAIDLNEQVAQYTILQSDWEQTKKLCDVLDDRIRQLNVTEDVGVLNISILEVARPAEKPSEPQKARIMGMALVFALMLGGGLAFVRDWLDRRLRSAEEISSVLGIPVLGVVPSMSRRQSIAAQGRKVHLDSNSHAAEAYRTIRTSVFFGVPQDEAKTVLVTSPRAGEGKTTLVSNLAIAMAKAGQRTLILDADFRKPTQHTIFKVDKDKGLSSVLAGTTTLQEAIQLTEVEGLQLLPCGPEVPNPSEILNSGIFAKTLEHLSKKYDRVIIDSPPVTAVTDAQILAAICNITLLVLRAEKSTRRISQQARDGLLSVGAHILGAIVNDVSRKDGSYGYYYGYGYYGYAKAGHRKKEKTTDRKPAAAMEDSVAVQDQMIKDSR